MSFHKINKWLLWSLFMLMGIATLLIVSYIKNEHSTDLSRITIDGKQLNSKIDQDQFIEDDDIHLKNHNLYTKDNQSDLVFKVNKVNSKIKGMTLINKTEIDTNFGGKIEGDIQDVVRHLGSNYKQKKLRKAYRLMTYYDKDNHIKLSIIYKHDKIKKIEVYTK
ncbi:hypothetical protein HYE69_03865 [Staphylococcus sp. GSSP0090]|nr:hypothetical protein [Staphylococcus sp. GSSP0090]